MQLGTFKASTAIVFILVAPTLFADEASRITKSKELFRVAQIQETMTQQMAQSMDRIKNMTVEQLQASGAKLTPEQTQKMQEGQTQIMAVVHDAFSWDKIEPAMIKTYVDTYSDEELDGLIAFYKSPAGQAYVKKTPALLSKTMDILQERMVAIQPQMQKIMKQMAGDANAAPAEQQ